MSTRTCLLIGAPVDCGKRRRGCLMGPDALRTAGLAENLRDLGHRVVDLGNVAIDPQDIQDTPEDRVYKRGETIAWTRALSEAAQAAMARGTPIFLGGDHALSAGSVRGVARYAAAQNRPQFLLWLDAHSDFHTPKSSETGHLHGTPVGYLAGRAGFDDFPDMSPLPHDHIAMIGLRSVDHSERSALQDSAIWRTDMRDIDEHGIRAPLAAFLGRVRGANGLLHVSLDVDFLDPSVAPAVGTTVPGGATVREAHLVMEMLCDSDLMSSLDIVELNPFLDERGRTASLMVELAASGFGRRIFDRPTQSYY